uniref:ATP synthase c subunit lysine N-methyltransferase n=1 Tax=Anser cygnoides TaxID=8845 RepID=A0A8B9E7B5_ANSCY
MASKALVTESRAALVQGSPEERTKRRQWGLLATGAVGGVLVALYAVVTPFLAPALRKVCLPFVPATSTQIENVLKMLQGRSGSLADIGSGDGRVVIAAAKMGFKAVGYELNPWLVWYSRYRAWRDGVHHNTKFYISDLWKVSFSHYTNVVIFGVPQMRELLQCSCCTRSRFECCEFSGLNSRRGQYKDLNLQSQILQLHQGQKCRCHSWRRSSKKSLNLMPESSPVVFLSLAGSQIILQERE